ncbi:thioredoxin family protein [Pseudomonas sp. CGJS7]|uniref:thioredoxin family protein n=1 Tax=Pseudomonas sp. CGJS7 TaxID=3109348 RepID=UPI00300B3765
MSKTLSTLKPLLCALSLCLAAVACTPGAQAEPVQGTHTQPAPTAPEFAGIERWINSPPLTMAGLRGKVVLVEFWTYSCINCIRVMPHVKQWHQRYRDSGLTVVGVHTPEYGYEKIPRNVDAAVARFGIEYPVAQDNAYATWNAYHNRYWPALYLIDRNGRVVYEHFGEGDYAQTEAKIKQLLAER